MDSFSLWLYGVSFIFNCYRHWSFLLLRDRNGTASLLHSWEDVMQADPLNMVVYVIGFLLLIKLLKADPDITQPWYADHVGALSTY